MRRWLLAVAMTAAALSAEPAHRRLFLDALVVEEQQGLERVFHALEKYAGNPLIVADTPWERGGSGPYLYGTVLNEGGLLRMWYHYIQKGYRNAYAESRDGIRWTKPHLGVVDWEGSTANNIVVSVTQDPAENPPEKQRGQCHNPAVIPRPEGGYALFCYGADYGKVRAAFSEDGLRWRFVPETSSKGLFDSSDVVNFFYDPYGKRYVATWKGPTRRGRSVGIATSADGLNWVKPSEAPVFTADDLDPPDTQIYGMPVFPYEGLYIGMPWIYHASSHYAPEMLMTRKEAEAQSLRVVDVQFVWSWDLVNWTRTPQRMPFLARGPDGAWDSAMVYTARAPVRMGDKLYFYYGGFDRPHDAKQNHGAIGLATLRLDGFCSMRAGPQGGWLTTRREKFRAPRLRINASTRPDGEVRAELLDLKGNVAPGFGREQCTPFHGDSTAHELRWKTVSLPGGDGIFKIRFILKNADLYSYQTGG